MSTSLTTRTAQQHFQDARRKAMIGDLLSVLRQQPNDLLSLNDIRLRLNIRGQRWLGHQAIPLGHIVGSEGRYADFDRQFLPRTNVLKDRWTSVDRAMLANVTLPPIEAYQISDVYIVRDGNHRVSVARQLGQVDIDAYVTELLVDVPLTPNVSLRDLLLKEEYSDFLEWTGLHHLRPDERIEFSELGGYLDLVQHINAHRYYLGQDLQREIGRDEAVASWYDHVYMPIVEVIREQGALQHFPGRSEADLYRWVIDHRWTTRERTGSDPGAAAATSDYVELFGQRSLANTLGAALRGALERLGVRLF